jgi:virginiamycin B lyase
MRRLTTLAGAAALLGSATGALAQQQSGGPPVEANFPNGPGKQTVVEVCGACHDLVRLTAGYTPEGWLSVTAMMRNFGAPVPADEWDRVRAYLIRSFPERPRPEARLLPGPAQVFIMQWPLPTPGSRPHDPMVAHDGAIWWTGQLANKLGRLDPQSGQMREYPVNAQSAPHGLVEDKDGNVWFTGNFRGFIGRLDPRSGDVKEYQLPDARARDPHTIVIDHDGIIWFTVQAGNFVGRLDPATGDIKLAQPPTANARPYGTAVNSKNQIYFVEFGAPKIATIDRNMHIEEFELPDPAARPRRIAITPDDQVWYTDFARGYLGHFDPASHKVEEFASPSGPKSQPYGIVATKGALWYVEAGAKPNAVVRFDPNTRAFQSWAIPGGGDIVRNMTVDHDGNPIMANSLVNMVGRVEIKSASN